MAKIEGSVSKSKQLVSMENKKKKDLTVVAEDTKKEETAVLNIDVNLSQTEGEKQTAGLETELASLIQKKNHIEEHSKAKNKDALIRKLDKEIDQVSKELHTLTNKTPEKEKGEINETLEIIPEIIPKEVLEKVDTAREKYIKEYNNCKKEADRQNLIQKTKNSLLNLFKSKENKTPIKTEDYFTDKLKESKKEFDQARIEMGNVMFEQRKAELEKAGLSGKDLENALINYKATEILSKTIIEERQKIIDLKAEKSSIKPALWKRMIDGYMNIKPRWKRVALSTLVFLPVAAMGAMGASAIAAGGIVAGLGSLAAVKFSVSMGLGTVAAYSAKGIDYLKKNSDAEFNEKINNRKQTYQNELAKGSLGLEEYEKGIDDIENEEKKHNRNRVLLKAGVGLAIAGTAGFAAYDLLGNGLHHIPGAHGAVDASHIKAGSQNTWPDNAKPGAKGIWPENTNKPETGNGNWPDNAKPGAKGIWPESKPAAGNSNWPDNAKPGAKGIWPENTNKPETGNGNWPDSAKPGAKGIWPENTDKPSTDGTWPDNAKPGAKGIWPENKPATNNGNWPDNAKPGAKGIWPENKPSTNGNWPDSAKPGAKGIWPESKPSAGNGNWPDNAKPGAKGIWPENTNKPEAGNGNWPDNAKPGAKNVWPPAENVKPGVIEPQPPVGPLIHHAPVEATADHGQGAISTIRELQHNLKAEYGNNLDNAPASVKHILNTDPHKLAQEYGMYKPGQDAESALIKSGSTFRVDESGNVTFHPVGGHDAILEKGVEVKASNVYEGRMVDTDHSGLKIENIQHHNPDGAIQQVDPVTGEPIINTPHYDPSHPGLNQVDPETGQPIIDTPQYNPNNSGFDQHGQVQQIEAVTGKPMGIDPTNPDSYNPGVNNHPISTSPDHLNPAKDLSALDLKQVQETYTKTIEHIFPTGKLMSEWDNIKNYVTAERVLELAEKGELKPELQPLVHIMHNIQDTTGLNPQGESLINPNPETISQYLNRGFEGAKYIGKLDDIQL